MNKPKHSVKKSEAKEAKKLNEKIAVKPVHLDGTNFMVKPEKSDHNKNQLTERVNKFEDNILDDLLPHNTEKILYDINTFEYEVNSQVQSTHKRKSLQKSIDHKHRQTETNFDIK